jgi:hypothetical protein
VAVVKEAPFKLRLVEPRAPRSRPAVAHRKDRNAVGQSGQDGQNHGEFAAGESFAGQAKVRLLGLPDRASAAAKEITSDATEVVFEVVVDAKCPLGPQKNLVCVANLT